MERASFSLEPPQFYLNRLLPSWSHENDRKAFTALCIDDTWILRHLSAFDLGDLSNQIERMLPEKNRKRNSETLWKRWLIGRTPCFSVKRSGGILHAAFWRERLLTCALRMCAVVGAESNREEGGKKLASYGGKAYFINNCARWVRRVTTLS